MQHSWERGVVYRVLVWRPEGKRPLGRPDRRCDDNIKMDLPEIVWEAWTGLTGSGFLLMRE